MTHFSCYEIYNSSMSIVFIENWAGFLCSFFFKFKFDPKGIYISFDLQNYWWGKTLHEDNIREAQSLIIIKLCRKQAEIVKVRMRFDYIILESRVKAIIVMDSMFSFNRCSKCHKYSIFFTILIQRGFSCFKKKMRLE